MISKDNFEKVYAELEKQEMLEDNYENEDENEEELDEDTINDKMLETKEIDKY